jgi:hypothetical protein
LANHSTCQPTSSQLSLATATPNLSLRQSAMRVSNHPAKLAAGCVCCQARVMLLLSFIACNLTFLNHLQGLSCMQ